MTEPEICTFVAPNPGAFTLDGTRSYSIGGEAIIDPGPAVETHVSRIARELPALRLILITHRHEDHAPAAIALKQRTGASIVAPMGVLDDLAVDRRIGDEDVIELASGSIRVIATPGHTSEHVCFLTSRGDLFTGDTILGKGTSAIFPPDGRMGDYLESLKKLRSLSPARIFPGHGPIRTDAVLWIDSYIAHRHMREDQIFELLVTARSIEELRRAIYPNLDHALQRAAESQLLAHLIHLEEKNKVDRNGDRWVRSEGMLGP